MMEQIALAHYIIPSVFFGELFDFDLNSSQVQFTIHDDLN